MVNFIAHGLSKAGGEERSERDDGAASPDSEREGDGSGSALEKYAVNLNAQAQEGRIDPLIGRKLEIERTIEILCRRRKNNPLYVGEAGVGTAHVSDAQVENMPWAITAPPAPKAEAEAADPPVETPAEPS